MFKNKKLFRLIYLFFIVTNLTSIWAQTTCKNGLGRVLYERLPNQQLQGYDDDVVRDTAPPFRVLEKCQDLCLRDRTGTNNLVRTCTSFDFQPGSRIASFGGNAEYEESICYLTSEQAGPEGIGSLMLVPNSVHFNEICLTSSRPERECPSRRYVFERHPRKKLKLPLSDIKEITAANRSDCEDKCLNEFSFVCRSANFDSTMRTCTLSRFTRRTHPELLEDDPNSDYLENTCLNAERRCDGLAVFVKEENKRLGGPFEVDIFNNMTLEECQTMCLRAEKYFCRSVEFDDQTKQCILSEEDSISQKDDISISSSPTHHFYDLVCLDNQRATDYPSDNSVTSHLFSSGRRPDTAFQRYRNSRLGGEFHSEITGRSLSECLDECLRQTSFQCRSAVYSDRFRTCRLSRYNQKDGMRIIYDADYDYYENLMLNVVGSAGTGSSGSGSGGTDDDRLGGHGRPDGGSGHNSWRPPSDRDKNSDDRFGTGGTGVGPGKYPHAGDIGKPYDRYPDSDYDRYPGGDRFPSGDRYPPSGGDRYPPSAGDRYPTTGAGDRFPSAGGGDRYPAGGGDRYPAGGGDRYPAGGGDRYPAGGGDRYPDRYPPTGGGSDRYPSPIGDRYPGEDSFVDRERYPGSADRDHLLPDRGRYPSIDDDRYPGKDRYPSSDRFAERYPNRDQYADRYPYPVDRERDRYPTAPFGDREPYPIDEGRYPPSRDRDRYPPPRPIDRYPVISDNGLPDRDIPHTRPYPPGDGPIYHRPYPGGSRYPEDGYSSRYPPSRYPPRDPGYPGRDSPESLFPDRRYRPSSFDSRYPPDAPRGHPSRYGPESERYPPDEIILNARRPEPESSKRYPLPPPPPPTTGKYPTSPNRFPVGTDRFPIDIYKYGNGDRYGGTGGRRPSAGYDRNPPPPSYYDPEYDDRYSDRPPPPYISPYDREFDGGYRRPGSPGGGAGGGGGGASAGPYPPYESPYSRPPYGGSSINQIPPEALGGPSGGGGGGAGPPPYGSGPSAGGSVRPPSTRCDDNDNFKQVAARHKMRRHFVRRALIVPSLIQCERECIESRDFLCRSFNYRDTAASTYDERDLPNCELSDRDSRELDVHDPNTFDPANYDFYERSAGRSDGECLDVSQTCNEEGMEFTIRTPEGFIGRIYTYGFYDRCFFRGNGGTVNVLRISGPQGYPDCGTQRYGDTLTNIVVVQFSDNVQTSRDKRYNLTCVFRGPGEAVVTSGYIGAGSGSPIPIEYLPAENTLSSKVRLMILYQGRPTTTIAVGDPLTFRLEAQDGYNHVTDIFATNVVARDPYSGRSIQLIDRFGCPVDPYVFPELDKLRDGDTLEARFNAFKIPESNFLVFEATVRSCREGCQPAYCPGPSGRQEPSFGRRRRSLNETDMELIEDSDGEEKNSTTVLNTGEFNKTTTEIDDAKSETIEVEEPEQVREMIEVFETREEIEKDSYPRKLVAPVETVCLSPSEYHGLLTAVFLLMILLMSLSLVSGLAYRRYWKTMSKNRIADRNSPVTSFTPSSLRTHERFSEINQVNNNGSSSTGRSNQFRPNLSMFGGGLQKTFATGNLARMCQIPVMNPIRNNSSSNNNQFDDPSEPIYTDPSLFERSRSLRSLSEEGDNHNV